MLMILRSLIIGSILLLSGNAFCQESKTSFEIFLLSDFSLQSYTENDLTNSYPLIEKDTRNDFDKTYGFGSQIVYELNSYLSAQFGLGCISLHQLACIFNLIETANLE
jgi:hypothetical protein